MLEVEKFRSFYVTSRQFEQTVRVFLRAGEDFEYAYDDHLVRTLIGAENCSDFVDMDHLRPSSWILEEVIPAINPSVLDRAFWNRCLGDALGRGRYARLPSTQFIMKHCDVESIRYNLLFLLRTLETARFIPSSSPPSDTTGDILLLLEASGGLHFLGPRWIETPISLALTYPRSFAALRTALKTASYDFVDVVRQEIDFRSNGWTEKTLLAVFEDSFDLKAGCLGGRNCGQCDTWLINPCEDQSVEWNVKLRRYREGLDQDAPLSEAEIQARILHKDAEETYKQGICWKCHEFYD